MPCFSLSSLVSMVLFPFDCSRSYFSSFSQHFVSVFSKFSHPYLLDSWISPLSHDWHLSTGLRQVSLHCWMSIFPQDPCDPFLVTACSHPPDDWFIKHQKISWLQGLELFLRLFNYGSKLGVPRQCIGNFQKNVAALLMTSLGLHRQRGVLLTETCEVSVSIPVMQLPLCWCDVPT